jgi:hypothetical protein
MKKIIVIIAVLIASLAMYFVASAEEGCTTGDYQGAPVDICPVPIPDPTNCYTGDFQGAPIEVCMPTGWVPDPTWTYNDEPIVMHVSKDYVAPVVEEVVPVTEVATQAYTHQELVDLVTIGTYFYK